MDNLRMKPGLFQHRQVDNVPNVKFMVGGQRLDDVEPSFAAPVRCLAPDTEPWRVSIEYGPTENARFLRKK